MVGLRLGLTPSITVPIKNDVYRWDVVIVTVVGLRLGLTPSLTVPIKNDVYRWDVVIVTWSDYG